MLLGLLLGSAALLVGGKMVVDTVNDMSKEEIEELANGIKSLMGEITETSNELNELNEIYKAADECEKELDKISKM